MTHDERIVFRLGCEESILHDMHHHVDTSLDRLRELEGLGFLDATCMRNAVDAMRDAEVGLWSAHYWLGVAKRVFMEGD